ncbi:MAG: hypothetical protein AB2A00_10655 [Myxococcota bacterium]
MAHATILQSFLVPFLMAAQDTSTPMPDFFPYGVEQKEDVGSAGDEERAFPESEDVGTPRDEPLAPVDERDLTLPPSADEEPFPPVPMGDEFDLPRDDDVGPDLPLPEDVPLQRGEGVFEPEGNVGRDLQPAPILPAPEVEPDL